MAGFSYLESLLLVGYVDGEDCYVEHRRSGTAPILIVLDQFKLPQRKAPMTEHDRDRCTYTAHRLECWMRTHINIMNKADTRHSRYFPYYFTTLVLMHLKKLLMRKLQSKSTTYRKIEILFWIVPLRLSTCPKDAKQGINFQILSWKMIFPNFFFSTF